MESNQETHPGAKSRGKTLPTNLSELPLSRPHRVSPEMSWGKLVTRIPGCHAGLAQRTEGPWAENTDQGRIQKSDTVGRLEDTQLRVLKL